MWHALRSLRGRSILSHILPLLIIVPLMGIALIYAMESQVLLRSVAADLTDTAATLARLGAAQPGLWADRGQAQAFVNQLEPQLGARLLLLDANGRILAASDPAGSSPLVEAPARAAAGGSGLPGVVQALAGHRGQWTSYSRQLNAEVVAVTAPVRGPGGRVVGVIYLARQAAGIYDQFLRLRYLIGGILLAGLLVGTAIGWLLALDLQAPLARLTGAVRKLAAGEPWTPVAPAGPEEVRLLTQTVNSLVANLRGLEQNRRQLLANLVHELGRPLGSLSLAAQALQRGADQDPVLREEFLAGIEGEIQRLRRLLDDLARLYDQVAGTLQLVKQPTPLSSWLCDTLPVWRAAAEEQGLAWETRVPDGLPVVTIDPDRLGQALGNLLSNAIKYTPPGGQICVEAGSRPGAVWVAVADTGPGIPPDERERIFEPLQRGRQPALGRPEGRRFRQGMGLGLTIARDLVQAHGGRLELESWAARGSRFTLWLPIT